MLDYFQNLIANCASKWRPVVGYEGLYEVSSDGEVRSLPRSILRSDRRLRRFPGKMMSGTVNNGRTIIRLRASPPTNKLLHRLVYEAHVGPIPPGMEIDHRSGDPGDNRLENLRVATKTQNQRNKVSSWSSSGHRGITYRSRQANKWSARIYIGATCKQIGSFATKEEAIAARSAAELEYWGDDAPAVVRK